MTAQSMHFVRVGGDIADNEHAGALKAATSPAGDAAAIDYHIVNAASDFEAFDCRHALMI